MTADLHSGCTVWLGSAAGIQWRIRPIALRFIRIDDNTSWAGNAYLDGYELGPVAGRIEPVEWRRCLVTDVNGVLRVRSWAELLTRMGLKAADYPAPIAPGPAVRPRPTNTSPSIPAQRTARTTARSHR